MSRRCPVCRLLVVLIALLVPAGASGDAEEASVHFELGPVLQRVEDARGQGATGSAPGVRLSVRGTYGLSNHVALEVGAGGIFAAETEARGVTLDTGSEGVLRQAQHAVRFTLGGTLRLGVKYIPTVTALVGYQHRFVAPGERWPGTVPMGPAPETAAAAGLDDLIAGLGVGFDFRLGARWIVGVSVQVVHAVSLDGVAFGAVEVPFFIAYYDYPRW